MRAPPRVSAALRAGTPALPARPSHPVIPAKAGIQTLAAKPVARNQVQIPTSGSLLPSWERARVRAPPRPSAALRAGRPRSQPALLPPSFPRKRESIRLQPSPSPEIKYKSQPADPFSLYGRKARMRAPPRVSAALRAGTPALPEPALLPRHSRESGNPQARRTAQPPKTPRPVIPPNPLCASAPSRHCVEFSHLVQCQHA